MKGKRWGIVNSGRRRRIQSGRKKKWELYNLIKLKFKCIWRLVLKDESAGSSTDGLHMKYNKLWGNCESPVSSNTSTFENGKLAPSPLALHKTNNNAGIWEQTAQHATAIRPSGPGAETFDAQTPSCRMCWDFVIPGWHAPLKCSRSYQLIALATTSSSYSCLLFCFVLFN